MKKELPKEAACLFCKIAAKEIPAKIAYEDESVVAFADINPLAPIHLLIITRKHVSSLNELEKGEDLLLGRMLKVAVTLAKKQGIAAGGYKLLIRTGEHGGQEVPHVHLHLIGGAPLEETIRVRKTL